MNQNRNQAEARDDECKEAGERVKAGVSKAGFVFVLCTFVRLTSAGVWETICASRLPQAVIIIIIIIPPTINLLLLLLLLLLCEPVLFFSRQFFSECKCTHAILIHSHPNIHILQTQVEPGGRGKEGLSGGGQ